MPITIPPGSADFLSFPDGSSLVTLKRLPRQTQKASVVATLLHFDGIAYPRAYFGENADESQDLSFRVVPTTDADQWTNLRTLLDARAVLLWRDVLGNSTYCIVTDISQDVGEGLTSPTYFTDVKLTIARVTYP
jgi:hypothetical protein